MPSTRGEMDQFRQLLRAGSLQVAYGALLSYLSGLRTHFKNRSPETAVSALYQGRMHITHFALFPRSLKRHGLKVPVVFNYDAFRFEAWLAGRNQVIQRQYWELIKDSPWPNTRVCTPGTGVFSILQRDLATDFDLNEPEALTAIIETATTAFIRDIEECLSNTEAL